MRRTKLIWFAAGAGATAIVALVSSFFLKPLVLDDSQVSYLILTEVEPAATATNPPHDESMIAKRTGEILRNCGARAFETTAMYEDHVPTAELPLIPENASALECVIQSIRDQNLSFRIESRWSSAVTDEMRTTN